MSKKYLVTWDMLQVHGKALSQHLIERQEWKGLIAVSRGGLVPAAIVARELNIRYVDTLCIASYHDHKNQTDMQLVKECNVPHEGEGFVIIDDLVDSGNTAKLIRKLYPKAYFVTVFAKPQGKPLVDFSVIDVPQDTWIEQPWDTAVHFIPPICDQNKQ
ncbi:MAG: xanthine phosphoribosyltransferase [Wohlfahrtiimonas sp.]